MVGRYIFVLGRFTGDLSKYLENSSVREVAGDSDGLLSPSKISRITTGKYTDLGIDEILYLCRTMNASPYDYIDKVMF